MSDQPADTNVEQSFQKQSHTTNRAWLIARLWVAAIILLLHIRLFFGEVMGDASIWVHEPFRSAAPPTFRKHVNEIQGDIWRQYVPFEQTLHGAGQAGRFAEWNPHIFLGHNFAGNAQAGHFHPLQIPFYFVDSFTWHGWSAVARLTVSAWFMLAWCRRVGLTPLAGSCSATSWVLSAFCTRWLQWTCISNASLTLPILLWAIERVIAKPNLMSVSLLSLAAIWLQLSGHPETQLLVGMIAGIYMVGVVGPIRASITHKLRLIGLALIAMVVGTVGAAASLLPFACALSTSIDLHENIHQMRGLVPLPALIEILIPNYFGRAVPDWPYGGPANYNIIALGFGGLALGLALIGLGRRAPRDLLAGFIMLISLMVLLALPPIVWLMNLPGLHAIKDHYLNFAFTFFGCYLAGVGFEQLCPSRPIAGKLRVSNWSWLWVVCLTLPMLVCGGHLAGLVVDSFINEQKPPAKAIWKSDRFAHFAVSAGLLAVGTVAGLVVIRARRRTQAAISRPEQIAGRDGLGIGPWVLLLACSADQFWSAHGTNNPAPRSMVDPPRTEFLTRLAETKGSARLMVAGHEMLFPNLAQRFGLYDVRGYDFPIPYRLAKVTQKLGIKPGTNTIDAGLLLPVMSRNWHTFLSRSSVALLLSSNPAPSIGVERLAQDQATIDWPIWDQSPQMPMVFWNKEHLPRCYVAETFRKGTADSSLQALLDPAMDPRQQAIIESAGTSDELTDSLTRCIGTCEFISYENERVEMRCSADREGLAVLTDRYESGWTVSIDDVDAKPVMVHYLYRGVIVPQGTHKIVWTYRAPGLRLGLLISLSVMAALIIALITGRRFERSSS